MATVRGVGTGILASSLLVGAGYGCFGENTLDLAGDWGHVRTEQQMEAVAQAEADQLFVASTAAGRFAILYLRPDPIEVGMLEGGKGLLRIPAAFWAEDEYYRYGQDCLAGSAYDIRPSEIRGRASGDINAVATLNMEGDTMVVYPAASDAQPLRFEQGDGGALTAADTESRATLEAYGCDLSIVTPPVELIVYPAVA